MPPKPLAFSETTQPKATSRDALKPPFVEDRLAAKEELSKTIGKDIARLESRLEPLRKEVAAIRGRARMKERIAQLKSEASEAGQKMRSMEEEVGRPFKDKINKEKTRAVEITEIVMANPQVPFRELMTHQNLDVLTATVAKDFLQGMLTDARRRGRSGNQSLMNPGISPLSLVAFTIFADEKELRKLNEALRNQALLSRWSVAGLSSKINEISMVLERLPKMNYDSLVKVNGRTIDEALATDSEYNLLKTKKVEAETGLALMEIELEEADVLYQTRKRSFLAEQKRYAMSQAETHNRAIRPFIWVTDCIGALMASIGIPAAFLDRALGAGFIVAGAGFSLVTRAIRRARPKVEMLTEDQITTRILENIQAAEIEPLETEKAQLVRSQFGLLSPEAEENREA